jgi:hypothetical protein
MYNNVYNMNTAYDYRGRAAQGRAITTDDIDDAIAYIKTLMVQNIKL